MENKPRTATRRVLTRQRGTSSRLKARKVFVLLIVLACADCAHSLSARPLKAFAQKLGGIGRHDEAIKELAVPALATLVLDPLLSATDSLFIGRLGTLALGALAPCTSLVQLFFCASKGLTQTATTLVGNASQRQNKEELRTILACTLGLSIGAGVLITLALRIKGSFLLSLLGVAPSSALHSEALSYLRVRALAAPAFLFILSCDGIFQGAGNTRIAIVPALLAAFINLLLDPILILQRQMGVRGAAFASTVAQYLAAALYGKILWSKRSTWSTNSSSTDSRSSIDSSSSRNSSSSDSSSILSSHPSSSPPPTPARRFRKRYIFFSNGSLLLKNLALMGTWAFVTARVGSLGVLHVAAHQVVLTMWMLQSVSHDAMAIAAQILTARYVAAGEQGLVSSLSKRLRQIAIASGALQCVVMILLHRVVVSLFTQNAEVAALMKQALLVEAFTQPASALALTLEGALAGFGAFSFLRNSVVASALLSASFVYAISKHAQIASVATVWGGVGLFFVFRFLFANFGVNSRIAAMPSMPPSLLSLSSSSA